MLKESSDNKIRVIYVAGYGFSGSTILEILLSCSDEVVGLGELVGIPRELNASFTKKILKKNSFCNKIFQRIEKTLQADGESLESITELNLVEPPLSRRTRQQEERYKRFWSTFLKAAAEDPDQEITSFVDSSKTTFSHAKRPYLLHNIEGIEVVMVQIIRHPRVILNRLKSKGAHLSDRNEMNWGQEAIQVFKKTVNWTFSNVWPAIFSYKLERYVRISFEELCEFPVDTLRKIEKECEIDLSNTINRVKNDLPLPPSCGIAGNIPVKKQGEELRFQSSKKTIPKTGPFIYLISLILVPIYKLLVR